MAAPALQRCLRKWHVVLETASDEGLEEILAENCVFVSPVVFTPQKGKQLTKMYLGAAKMVVGDEFHYIKEVASGHHAVLEFETKVDGKYVNGIDMITCDENGQITEFKVMIRPLQAVNMMHDKMKEMIKQMMPQGPPKRSSL